MNRSLPSVIDDSIVVRSFVGGLNNYCWEKSVLHCANSNNLNILHTRLCPSFSHRRIIGNSFLTLLDSLTVLKSYRTHMCLRTDIAPPPLPLQKKLIN